MYDGIIYTIDGRTCHQRETLRVVQENNLSVDMVKKIFIDENCEAIYIENGERLVGVVTLGLFSRQYKKTKKSWYNKNFFKIVLDDDDSIFVKKVMAASDIINIPIVDKNGRLLFLLSKEKEWKEWKEDYPIIKRMILDYSDDRDIFYYSKNNCDGEFFQKEFEKDERYWISTVNDLENCFGKDKNIMVLFDTEAEKKRIRLVTDLTLKGMLSMEQALNNLNMGYKLCTKIHEYNKRGVKIVFAEDLRIRNIVDATGEEWDRYRMRIIENKNCMDYLNDEKDFQLFKDVIGEDIFNDEWLHATIKYGIVNEKGPEVSKNFTSKYINNDGYLRHIPRKRKKEYEHTIGMIGICWLTAGLTDDDHTCLNYMQQKLNNENISYGIDAGYWYTLEQLEWWLQYFEYLQKGDILLLSLNFENEFLIDMCKKIMDLKIIEMSSVFNRPNNLGELFIDCPDHMGKKGQFLCSEKLYENMQSLFEC